MGKIGLHSILSSCHRHKVDADIILILLRRHLRCGRQGCELDFINLDAQVILGDPIWDTLQECHRFSLVVPQCFVSAEHKGQLRQRSPRAIRIPAEDTGFVLRHACSHVPDLRHVWVEEGINTIGASAWQSCQQLQIVKLPPSVVCLQDGAFQGCYALMDVLVPGCIRFGRRVFKECCSLYHVGTTEKATNQLAPKAQISPYTQFTKMEEKTTWRGPYAESNTFALCAKFHTPEWLNTLPPDGEDNQTFNSADFDEELRRSMH